MRSPLTLEWIDKAEADLLSALREYREVLERLTSYAVEYRYPGERATQVMAKNATTNAVRICRQLRADLGLPLV